MFFNLFFVVVERERLFNSKFLLLFKIEAGSMYDKYNVYHYALFAPFS